MIDLRLGNCLEVMKTLPDNSVDAIVTDPPYGLSFMGKKWDYDVPSQEIWEQALRVLKPGGYLLSFAGTRTQHRMAARIEDAGFEIRDMIAWVYGSGFPKSLNIGKAVDKLQGNERNSLGQRSGAVNPKGYKTDGKVQSGGAFKSKFIETKGTSEWEGWGTALKPALEPITVARKPLSEKNVAENVLKWGVGGIDIDGCRVGTEQIENGREGRAIADSTSYHDGLKPIERNMVTGRFPANLIHDGSDEVVGLFPNSRSAYVNQESASRNAGKSVRQGSFGGSISGMSFTDSGSAARFFYCAKASKSERNRGCEGMEVKQNLQGLDNRGRTLEREDGSKTLVDRFSKTPAQNNHPTVKPIALMEYLVKLVSREGAVVLDPFMGSGSTGIACRNLKRNFIGIEMSEEYLKIAEARINSIHQETML